MFTGFRLLCECSSTDVGLFRRTGADRCACNITGDLCAAARGLDLGMPSGQAAGNGRVSPCDCIRLRASRVGNYSVGPRDACARARRLGIRLDLRGRGGRWKMVYDKTMSARLQLHFLPCACQLGFVSACVCGALLNISSRIRSCSASRASFVALIIAAPISFPSRVSSSYSKW